CANRVRDGYEHDGDRATRLLQRARNLGCICEDHVGLQGEQLLRGCLKLLGSDCTKSRLNTDIAAGQPSKFFQLLPKRPDPRLHCRVVLDDIRDYTDKRHALALLRPRHKRPCRRAAEQRDELASLHRLPQPEHHTLSHPGMECGVVHYGKTCGLMSQMGLGRVKTQASVVSVENLEGIARRESQIMLHI